MNPEEYKIIQSILETSIEHSKQIKSLADSTKKIVDTITSLHERIEALENQQNKPYFRN